MSRRRQSTDEDVRLRIAEAGHRAAPVVLVAVGAALLAGNLLTPGDKPGTLAAGDEGFRKSLQGEHKLWWHVFNVPDKRGTLETCRHQNYNDTACSKSRAVFVFVTGIACSTTTANVAIFTATTVGRY